MLSRSWFQFLDYRWVPHTVDLFASNANNQCARFFSLHWCMGSSGINAFGQLWVGENCWVNGPFNLIGNVWKSLREQMGTTSVLIPIWESAPWWHLVCPNASRLSDSVVDWLPLPKGAASLFVAGTAPGRAVMSPDWPILAFRLDFSATRSFPPLSKRDRCFRGGCSACGSRSWHRKQ